ncbi:hypothetical protein GCM10025865_04430 [Paraoerskovia sediminicola]|uniref:HTH merR-type domain-containing protein n=1 Tax=Paraoerskovia sediminicola TaxID=1138587 RepID=A0ABN6X8S2_9CELL|nr:MerR family transcriptional regulator [Paraoerskovia sediminicola]BDZ41144.1 hypothetical protein GCM10025865_04430 [Paraoerskovia sediminicola]
MTPPDPTSRDGDGGGTDSGALGHSLTVAAVARRLGVAPATLRTWDRRYGLGPSSRTAGSHRRYTGDDVARLLVMRGLTIEGVAPVDAAASALEADVSEIDPWGDGGGMLGAVRAAGQPQDAAQKSERGDASDRDADPAGDDAADGDTGRARRSGLAPVGAADAPPRAADPSAPGRPRLRALPTPGSEPGVGADGARGRGAPQAPSNAPSSHTPSVSDIVDAAIAYDQDLCDELLHIDAETDPGVWWPNLVDPAFRRLRERTVLAGPGEDPVVLLANATLHALRRSAREREAIAVAAGAPPANHPSRMRRIVLIFVAPEERLPLAAHALAAALESRGGTAKIVTGPANTHRSLEIVTMVRPAAVVAVTSLQRPVLDVVDATHEANPELPIFVGLSHDAVEAELPLATNVLRVRSFTGLLHEVLATVG